LNALPAGHLRLEPQVAGHAPEMFEVLRDPAIYEFENEPPSSLEWLERRYRQLETRRSPDGSERWLNWVIRLPSGRLAGYVQATVLQESTAFIAYELASRFWRQGIGSIAVAAILQELVPTYEVHTCMAVFKTRNFRSEALLRHLGFASEPPEGLAPVPVEPDERVMYKRVSDRKKRG
jgi:RimJ/RimL family protein N-acetyltransferase